MQNVNQGYLLGSIVIGTHGTPWSKLNSAAVWRGSRLWAPVSGLRAPGSGFWALVSRLQAQGSSVLRLLLYSDKDFDRGGLPLPLPTALYLGTACFPGFGMPFPLLVAWHPPTQCSRFCSEVPSEVKPASLCGGSYSMTVALLGCLVMFVFVFLTRL